MNAFDNIINYAGNKDAINKKKISASEYHEWKKQWIFDALKDYRLGQSFCEYFDISNASPLYYFRSNNLSDQWIRDNYLT